MKNKFIRSKSLKSIFILSILLLSLSGCSILKASSPETSDFLPYPYRLKEMNDMFPAFSAAWIEEPVKLTKIITSKKKLVVKPVVTTFAERKIEEQSGSERSRKMRNEELQEIARYMQVSFESVIKMDTSHPLKISNEISSDTLILELALTEVSPTNPYINTLGTAAGFFVPGGGLVKIAGKGEVAMEGLLRDGAGGSVIMEFKDRETDKAAPFTIKDFQEYAHIREAIQDWAMQTARILTDPVTLVVEDSSPVTLLPF